MSWQPQGLTKTSFGGWSGRRKGGLGGITPYGVFDDTRCGVWINNGKGPFDIILVFLDRT